MNAGQRNALADSSPRRRGKSILISFLTITGIRQSIKQFYFVEVKPAATCLPTDNICNQFLPVAGTVQPGQPRCPGKEGEISWQCQSDSLVPTPGKKSLRPPAPSLSQRLLVAYELPNVSLMKHHNGHGVHLPALLCGLGCHSKALGKSSKTRQAVRRSSPTQIQRVTPTVAHHHSPGAHQPWNTPPRPGTGLCSL